MGFPNALSIEHHAFGPEVDAFAYRFGSRSERLSQEDRLHLIAAIAITLQLQISECGVLTLADGLGEHPFCGSPDLDTAVRILDEADARSLGGLMSALCNQVKSNI